MTRKSCFSLPIFASEALMSRLPGDLLTAVKHCGGLCHPRGRASAPGDRVLAAGQVGLAARDTEGQPAVGKTGAEIAGGQ
ncbi:hypothetical protein [Arthrobacter pigmenti]